MTQDGDDDDSDGDGDGRAWGKKQQQRGAAARENRRENIFFCSLRKVGGAFMGSWGVVVMNIHSVELSFSLRSLPEVAFGGRGGGKTSRRRTEPSAAWLRWFPSAWSTCQRDKKQHVWLAGRSWFGGGWAMCGSGSRRCGRERVVRGPAGAAAGLLSHSPAPSNGKREERVESPCKLGLRPKANLKQFQQKIKKKEQKLD